MSTGRERPDHGDQAKHSSPRTTDSTRPPRYPWRLPEESRINSIRSFLVMMFAPWRLPGMPYVPGWSRTLRVLSTSGVTMLWMGVILLLVTLEYPPNFALQAIAVLSIPALGLANMLIGQRVTRRRAREYGYAMCLRCEYPLDWNRPEGRCPECGLEYDLRQTRRAWAEFCNTGADLQAINAELDRTDKRGEHGVDSMEEAPPHS
jgi:hypothetical protein